MNKVNATRSFVDFVLPKLFPHISIVLELLRDGKWKVTQYECLRKGNSGGSIWVCPTCSYLNINQLKNLVHLNLVLIFCIRSILWSVAVHEQS